MARLKAELLERVERLADRCLDVAGHVAAKRRFPRLIEQMTASGTSIGANVFEADEAMSTKDFCKCLRIAVKELNEARYWLRLFTRRGWVAAKRIGPLETELVEVRKVLGAMIGATMRKSAAKRP